MNEEIFNALQAEMAEPTKLEVIAKECQLDIFENVPPPPVAILIGESPSCTFGNFSAAVGSAKSKKTFNGSAIVAAALSGRKILEYQGRLPAEQSNVLYFYTEQSKYHALKVFKRIARLSGMSDAEVGRRVTFCALRKYSVDDRMAIIEKLIYDTAYVGLVVIDGVRDLLFDINSPKEATDVVNKLMKWTEERNFHLHTIIHQNKNDNNARGHIGTEIINKAETILKIEKVKNQDYSTVEAGATRDIPFETFVFRINDQGLPEIVEDFEQASSSDSKWEPFSDIPSDTHRRVLFKIFEDGNKQLKRGELSEGLKLEFFAEGFRNMSQHRIRKLIDFYTNKRMIEQVQTGLVKGNPFRLIPDYKD